MRRIRVTGLALLGTGLVAVSALTAVSACSGGGAPTGRAATWRVAWGTAVDDVLNHSVWTQHPTHAGTSTAPDATYRFMVRPTVSGTAVRLRLSNVDGGTIRTGREPVTFDAVKVAVRQGNRGANVVAGTTRQVTFHGRTALTLGAGGTAVSDPIDLRVQALHDLAVSVYAPKPTVPPLHEQTYRTQYATPPRSGDHTSDATGAAFTQQQEPIYWLDAVDVLTTAPRAVVAIGDSITDGDVGQANADDFGMDRFPTWPDRLAIRLAGDSDRAAVVNEGVNGDFTSTLLDRLPHDVLSQSGVTDVVVEAGTNDITFGVPAATVIAHLREVASRLHAHGLRVIAATLVPRARSTPDLRGKDAERAQVNAFLRTSPLFDGVLDIARIVGRPLDDNRYAPAYDSGDHLHPNPTGYQAIADGFDISPLTRG